MKILPSFRGKRNLIITSLVIALILSFRAASLFAVGIFTILLGLFIFVFLDLILRVIRNIKDKAWKGLADNFGEFIVLIFIVAIVGSMFLAGYPAITPAHFRTNIITGNCNFGGYSGDWTQDPWYYKEGCNISYEERIALVKNSKYYPRAIEQCKNICGDNFRDCDKGNSFLGRQTFKVDDVDEIIWSKNRLSCADIAE